MWCGLPRWVWEAAAIGMWMTQVTCWMWLTVCWRGCSIRRHCEKRHEPMKRVFKGTRAVSGVPNRHAPVGGSMTTFLAMPLSTHPAMTPPNPLGTIA
jgi:hypothetical protein